MRAHAALFGDRRRPVRVPPRFRSWTTAARVWLCLPALAAAACATVAPQTPLMRTAQVQAPAGELRAIENALALSIPSDIEASADEIMNHTDDPAVRDRALRWKMEAIPAYYQALFQGDPLAAAIETLVLSAQIDDHLTDGAGRDRFGALQAVAVEAAHHVRTGTVNALKNAARRPDAFDRTQANIDAWARANPIGSAPLSSRPSSIPFVMQMAGSQDSDVFGAVADIRGSVADIATRLDIYSAYLPKAARWQSELLSDEIGMRSEVRLATATLESATRMIDRIETLTSPESLDRAAEFGAGSVRAERVAAMEALDTMKSRLLAYVTTERQAVFASTELQTTAALKDIDRQRTSTLRQADDLRKDTLASADGLRRETVQDLDRLANRIIFRAALALAALLVLAALLAIAVLKTTTARPPRGTLFAAHRV